MDLYTLDPTTYLRRSVIDVFASLVWTERYNEFGDITLTIPAKGSLGSVVQEGDLLGVSDSNEIMIIDTLSYADNLLTVTGGSLTGFLRERVFRGSFLTGTDNNAYTLTGSPSDLAESFVTNFCTPSSDWTGDTVVPNGHLDVIPGLTIGPIASPGASVTVSVPYGYVYDAVKGVCDIDNLGFKIYVGGDAGDPQDLIFTVYEGLDRTTSQSVNAVVIFEPALDSFTDIKELRSIAGYRNIAYAWPNGITDSTQWGVATAPGASLLTGLDRRVLYVDANDLNASDYTDPVLIALLNQKAADGLANNNYVKMVDGQVVPQTAFKYGTDYNLGDIIELRGTSDIAQQARVTEYIRSQDATGETAYPTLSVIS